MERRMGSGGTGFGVENPYDAAFPSLGAMKQRPDKQRKKITPTPVAAAQVDSTFLLAQPSEDPSQSFRKPTKSVAIDLRLLLKEKRGRQKGGANKETLDLDRPHVLQQGVESQSGAVSVGQHQPKRRSGALESRLGGGQTVGGFREVESGELPGASVELLSPPRSRRLNAPLLEGSPLNEPRLRTPTSDPPRNENAEPSPHRKQQIWAQGTEVPSPVWLPEKPPKLPPEKQRAAAQYGELLKRGGVSSLLRELQLVVELLTADQTSCEWGHPSGDESAHVTGGCLENMKRVSGTGKALAQREEYETGEGLVSRTLSQETAEPPKNGEGKNTDVMLLESRKGPADLRQEAEAESGSRSKQGLGRFPGTLVSKEKRPPAGGSDSVAIPSSPSARGPLAFCCGDMAAAYACVVLETSLPLILHCGEPILTALLNEPAVARHSPSLAATLRDALIAHQSASLRGLGTPQKRGGSQGGAPLSALPFDEEQDSRNIPAFKTQEGQRLFSNREECRDIFYCIIRDAASTSANFASEPIPPSLKSAITKQPYRRPAGFASEPLSGSFGAALPRPEKPLSFPARIRKLLAHLHESNYPWLAKLFVQQIIQVASTGETDPEVRNLARENTAKLQRLHSRLTGAGAAPVRLAAGGTPTRESPGRRPRGLDGTSPVFVGGVRQGSPSLESASKGDHQAGNVGNNSMRGICGGSREELPAGKTNGSREYGQPVRRTLEESFRESGVGDSGAVLSRGVLANKTGQRAEGILTDKNGDPKPVTFARATSLLLITRPSSATDSSTQPGISPAQHLESEPEVRKGLSVAVAKPGDPLAEDGPFGGLFPRALLPYVRFVQAADSHRLHLLLLCCIADSIQSLSQIGAASVFSASAFSERLVTLQTLARFLGFLLFAPVFTTGHSTLPTDPKTPIYTWSGELPLSLVDTLRAAVSNGSLVLSLPWVLEVLGMMRACAPAKSAPAFVRALTEVEKLQGLRALQPGSPAFGLPSMCIVAALDGFFREDGASPAKPLESPSATWPPRDAPDSMPGLIDARYIQNCCPLLDDLAASLVEGRQRASQIDGPDAPKPGDRRLRPIRKITPTAPPQAAQPGALPADVLAALPPEDAVLVRPAQRDPLMTKLEGVFFEQQPQLRRLVDFVADTVAANSALAAQLATCPDVIGRARVQLTERAEKDAADAASVGRFEVFVEQTILNACRQSLPSAIAYARTHSWDRVREALGALARPNVPAPVLGTAAAIAAQASAVGAVRAVLVNVPKEIRQRLTEDAEKLKRKLVTAMRGDQARKLPG